MEDFNVEDSLLKGKGIMISACLLGIRCRYDGRHSICPDLVDFVASRQFTPFCPEQTGGLPTPRPAANIIGGDGRDILSGTARLVDNKGKDVIILRNDGELYTYCDYKDNEIKGLTKDERIWYFDKLNQIEDQYSTDSALSTFLSKYGRDLVLVGNVPIPLLTHGTPEDVVEYVKYLLANVSADGGHIISSSHSVTQWCKVENFYAYHKAVDTYGWYPIKIN